MNDTPPAPAAAPTAVAPLTDRPGLVAKFAARYFVEPDKLLKTLKATAFKVTDSDGQPLEPSNEQMMALLVVADQHNLNPFTREIYAFLDKHRGVVPIVGVDGWIRKINEHPEFDGVEFMDDPEAKSGEIPKWIECRIFRKDRRQPVVVREYFAECKRNTGPWGSHPRRMLRHKALIQCARVAFGFTGIYDEDEAERIVQGTHVTAGPDRTPTVALPKAVAAPGPDGGSGVAGEAADGPQGGQRDPAGEPGGPKADPAAKIGKGVQQTLRNHLSKKKIPESEFCHNFEIEKLEDLPQAKAAEAGDWISKYDTSGQS